MNEYRFIFVKKTNKKLKRKENKIVKKERSRMRF